MDYTPDVAPPADEPVAVRINGVKRIELGGIEVDPCDIVALADALETIDLRTMQHVRTPRALVFVRDVPHPFASELTREEVRARIDAELAKREAIVRSRMTAAMRAARKAADPDADAPWKQGE